MDVSNDGQNNLELVVPLYVLSSKPTQVNLAFYRSELKKFCTGFHLID